VRDSVLLAAARNSMASGAVEGLSEHRSWTHGTGSSGTVEFLFGIPCWIV
jgi:hypothetical protein